MIDILDEMTVEEIKYYIRHDTHYLMNPIKRSKAYFYRWEMQSKVLTDLRNKDILDWGNLNGKKRDETAKKFNKSRDVKEKDRLAKQLITHDNNINKLIKQGAHIEKLQKKNDDLYKQINIERQKEK